MKRLGILLFLLVAACAPVTVKTEVPSPTSTRLILPTQAKMTATPTKTPAVVVQTPSPTPEIIIYTVEAGDTLWAIAERFGVPIDYLVQENGIKNQDLIQINQVLIIPAWPPNPPVPDIDVGKEIIVVLSTQTTCASENGVTVKCVLASTGTDNYPTPIGHYKIYFRAEFLDMKGPGYFLPDVPWNLCFLPRGLGYCIHGTYWHSNFGHKMSHGCVNLSIDNAKWFYDWADEDTVVWVKE